MINEPLQKQIVPFTLEKCIIRIIWQIKQTLKWTAVPLPIQLLFTAVHLPRLGILKLTQQTCWLSCYSYLRKLLNFSDLREIFVGASLLQDQPGGPAHGLAPWKKGNTGSYTWVTLDVSDPGPVGCRDFWSCIFCSIFLGSHLWDRIFCFAAYDTASLKLAGRVVLAFEATEEGVLGRQWRTKHTGVFYSMYCF